MTKQKTESASHTPGPWVANRACGSSDVRVFGCGYQLAILTGGEITRDIANANLIAAAPEMLAALKMIAHATAPSPDDGGHHENAYTLAIEAIAKAKGETND